MAIGWLSGFRQKTLCLRQTVNHPSPLFDPSWRHSYLFWVNDRSVCVVQLRPRVTLPLFFPSKPPQLRSTRSPRILHHPPHHHPSSFLPRPIPHPAAAFPPPLLRFSPVLKIPPHHPTLLPVPRVPFMSPVCQLAMMMAPAAATDPHSTITTTTRPQAASYTK